MESTSVNETVVLESYKNFMSEMMQMTNVTDLVYGGRTLSSLLSMGAVPQIAFWNELQAFLKNSSAFDPAV